MLKLRRKGRTYLGFVTLLVLLVVIAVALKRSPLAGELRESLTRHFIVLGTPLNGPFYAVLVMRTVLRLVPFFVALVCGEIVAGEAAEGTLRAVLARPLSRTRLLTAKFLVGLGYTAVLVAFLAVTSLGLGWAFLGRGRLLLTGPLLMGSDHPMVWLLSEGEALVRLSLAYLLVMWGTFVIAALAFLFSTLTENTLGPAIGALAIAIGFWTLETIGSTLELMGTPSPALEQLRPYLFTTYTDVWEEMFSEPIPWAKVVKSAAICGAHTLGFFGLAWLIFQRKDVTC